MNILPDTRDLIDLTEHSRLATSDEFREYLVSHNHRIVLTFNNVRELCGPLAAGGDFLRIRRFLQTLEEMPHTCLRELTVVALEIQSAVEAFTSGIEYKDVSPYVTRWDRIFATRADAGFANA